MPALVPNRPLPSVAVVCLAVLAAGCGPGGRIDGHVVDRHTATPLADITLTLEAQAALPVTTTSGADGSFAFRRLASGTYRLSAERAGWSTPDARTVSLQPEAKVDLGGVQLECTSTPCAAIYALAGSGRAVRLGTSEPAAGVQLRLGSDIEAETDSDGAFSFTPLLPFHEYDPPAVVSPGITGLASGFETQAPSNTVTMPDVAVFPTPPSAGLHVLSPDGTLRELGGQKLRYYDLKYYEGDKAFIAQSAKGRMSLWYVTPAEVADVPKLPRGTILIGWQQAGDDGGSYYDRAVPLFEHPERKIYGTKCSGHTVATLPAGWYAEKKALDVGEYNIYCYAPIRVSETASVSIDDVRIASDGTTVAFRLDLQPGRYAITNRGRSSGSRHPDWTEAVAFEIVAPGDGP